MKHARIITLIVILIVAIIAIAQNTASEETRFLFFTITMPRAVLLLITLLIGFVLGLFAATYISSPRRRGAQPPTSGESKSRGASK